MSGLKTDRGHHRTATMSSSLLFSTTKLTGLKKMPLFSTLLMLCCAAGFAHQVSAAGVFELQILSIEQTFPSEIFSHQESPISQACDQCQPTVHICMKESTSSVAVQQPGTTALDRPPTPRIPATNECSFAEFNSSPLSRRQNGNRILYESSIGSSVSKYELKFPFTFPWPDTFDMALQINNKSLTGKVLLAAINTTQTVRAQHDEWTYRELTTNTTSSSITVRFRMRIQCSDGSYGHDCNTKCTGRNDSFGHYVCAPNGAMQCLEGWQGELCTQPVCADKCHSDNGYCEEPGQCLCRQGWNDSSCSTCIKYPGCVHGGCNGPWQCLCETGWGGALCDLDLNVCLRTAPCRNGGRCISTPVGSYTCRCPKGFTGTDCEVRVDNCELSPCKNGGACVSNNATTAADTTGNAANRSNYTCVCPFTYTGRHCEIQAKTCDDNPCQNRGECVASSPGSSSPNGIRSSYTCYCAPGFEGSNCEVEINECASNPCNNGGSCVDEHNGFKCLCPNGYTGPTCSIDIDECSRAPCLNHGTCLDRVGHFFCVCPVGFSGALCQHISPQAFAASTVGNPCKGVNTNPCAHGATCEYQPITGDLQVFCHCQPGYTGRFCEKPTDISNNNKNNEEDNFLAIGVDEIHKQASFAANNNNNVGSSVAITIVIAASSIAGVLLILLGACGWFVISKRRQQQREQQYYCASTTYGGGAGGPDGSGSANSSPNISTLYSPKKVNKLSAAEADDDEDDDRGEESEKTGAIVHNDPATVHLNNYNNNSSLDSAQREAIIFAANTLSIMEALDKKRTINRSLRQPNSTHGFDEVDGNTVLRMQERRAHLLLPQQSESLYACKSDYGGTNNNSARQINNNNTVASLRRSPTTLGSSNTVAAQYSRLTTYNNTLGRKTQQRALLAAAAAQGSAAGGQVPKKNFILATENEHRASVMRQKQQQQQQRQSMFNCNSTSGQTTMPDILNTSTTIRRQITNCEPQARHYRSQYSLDAADATTMAAVHVQPNAERTSGEPNNEAVERRRARSSSHNNGRRRREPVALAATPGGGEQQNSECLYSQVNKKAKKPSEILTASSQIVDAVTRRESPSSSSTSSSTTMSATTPMLLPTMSNSSTTSTFCCSPTTAAAADQPLLYSLEEPTIEEMHSYHHHPLSLPSSVAAAIPTNGRVLNENKFLASRL